MQNVEIQHISVVTLRKCVFFFSIMLLTLLVLWYLLCYICDMVFSLWHLCAAYITYFSLPLC